MGDFQGAGQAALTVIEQLGEQLRPQDLSVTYNRAAELLADTRHPTSKDRLVACAKRVVFLVGALPEPPTWEGFSFFDAVLRYEARLIERALRDAGGVITRAARLLGIRRQSLDSMLHEGRHRALLPFRKPSEPRKSSLMFRGECCAEARPVTILHVEDDAHVADAVRTALSDEGWSVETCADGGGALERLAGGARYDVLIFDNQLPGVSGLELIRRTRALAHRQHTPIVMLSAGDVEREARRAGANAFLKKPNEVSALAETVARLLARRLRPR